MQTQTVKHSKPLFQLTALWAFSESGLGGLMHAFKIPLTGFFVGGFAIMILIIFANYSKCNARLILQSTLMVLSIKFAVSPHSPIPAYLAVGFQGLLAALILGVLKGKQTGAMLFGFIALIESALQKFLLTTLLFGKSIWEALDIFAAGLLKEFGFNHDFSFSTIFIICYCLIYAVWGLLVGWWAWRLPAKLELIAPSILEMYNSAPVISSDNLKQRHKKKLSRTTINLAVLLFIVLVFWFTPLYANKAVYAISRTIAAIMFIYLLLVPCSKWLLSRLLKNQDKNPQLRLIIEQLPQIKMRAKTAWNLAGNFKNKNRIFSFISILMVVTLYEKESEPESL
ncbi:MAG: hypothetical protein H7296_15735 [Bacteroidia bacterium]|nr:hypothetical protein [Bacteroidia bacterium]